MAHYGEVKDVLVDRCLNQALVTYATGDGAQEAVKQLKLRGNKIVANASIQIDFGSELLRERFGLKKPKLISASSSSSVPIVNGDGLTTNGRSSSLRSLSRSVSVNFYRSWVKYTIWCLFRKLFLSTRTCHLQE